MENIRELALDMLIEILEKGEYSHLVIRNVLDKYHYLDLRDKAFVKRVTEGTLERLIQIDYVLDQFSKVPVLKMKPLIRNLMRISVYQLLFMDQIPDSAVCNEAVKLAGKRGFKGLSGFVNGVLRNIARNRNAIVYPDERTDRVKALSIRYSMPQWLVEFWDQAYGQGRTEAILKGILSEHPVTVRLKESLSGKERKAWLTALAGQRIEVQPHPYLSYAFRLKGEEGVRSIPGYEEGLFVVQDVSSMLAVEAAGVSGSIKDGVEESGAEQKGKASEEELLVVDVCGAPGGKSLHMAEKLHGRGRVLSRDLTEYKVSLIEDNIQRTGYTNMEAQMYDAAVLDESLLEKADVVMADLPCSGLGIMGKKRDIKYRASRENMQELAALQRRILDTVWRYVKPGGVLIYSTCTVNPDENDNMVKWFVENHPFKLQSLAPYLPQALKEEGETGKVQFFPGIHETDGFFIARLVRSQPPG